VLSGLRATLTVERLEAVGEFPQTMLFVKAIRPGMDEARQKLPTSAVTCSPSMVMALVEALTAAPHAANRTLCKLSSAPVRQPN